MQPTWHAHHAPARIGGEDHNANHANRPNDQAAAHAAMQRAGSQAHIQKDQHAEECGESRMEEPGGRPERMFGGGVDARIKRGVDQVARKDRRRAKPNE